VLVELSVMEQRYQAVIAVIQDGWKVSEVADRLGVSRESVHTWIVRYEAGGAKAALRARSASCGDRGRREACGRMPPVGRHIRTRRP
jgi:transposase